MDRSYAGHWLNFAPPLTRQGGFVGRPDHPDTATLFNNPAPNKLPELYRTQGKYVEAEPLPGVAGTQEKTWPGDVPLRNSSNSLQYQAS